MNNMKMESLIIALQCMEQELRIKSKNEQTLEMKIYYHAQADAYLSLMVALGDKSAAKKMKSMQDEFENLIGK